MKTKILTGLLAGGFLLGTACNPRNVDDGTYSSGPDGATEEATATDQAETTVVSADSTPVIILTDSIKRKKGIL